MSEQFTDTDRLNALQTLLGTFTGRVNCRWSSTGRGWRLHEDSGEEARYDIREAIDGFLTKNGFCPGAPVENTLLDDMAEMIGKLREEVLELEQALDAKDAQFELELEYEIEERRNAEVLLGNALQEKAELVNELTDTLDELDRVTQSRNFYRGRAAEPETTGNDTEDS
jgi:Mg2+ and Co2+ transporter CorA